MTDEELAAINNRITGAWMLPGGFDVLYGVAEQVVSEDIPALLDEVERSREIVCAVANGPLSYIEQPEGWTCAFCDASTPSEWGEHAYSNEDEDARAKRVIEHTADCPVTKARAILGQ